MVDTPFNTYVSGLSRGTTTPTVFHGVDAAGLSKKYAGTTIINVLDFGASNNGTTECSANLQAAWNYASTIGLVNGRAQGARLYFPAGAYLCESRLVDPNGYPVSWVGDGSSHGSCSSQIMSAGGVAGFLVDAPDLFPNFTREDSHYYLAGVTVLWPAGTASSCTSSGTTLTVGGTVTGVFTVGRGIFSADFRLFNRYIVAQLSGTAGGAGTYQLDAAGTSNITTPTSVRCVMVTSCLRSGTSASSIPSTPGKVVGSLITDGSVTWEVSSLYTETCGSFNSIQDMGITNASTVTGDGALRIDFLAAGFFKNLRVAGTMGVHASGNQFGSIWMGVVANTSFADVGRPGTYGFVMGQNTMFDAAVNGFDVGVATYGSNFAMYGGHVETNTTGILLGMNPTGVSDIAHGSTIKGVSFERNTISIRAQSVAGFEISGCNFTGTIGPDGITKIQTGLILGDVQNGIIQGNTGGGQFSNAGYDFSASNAVQILVSHNSCSDVSDQGGVGVEWKMPTGGTAAAFTFVGNNNAATPHELTYSQLPGQPGVHPYILPMTGMEYDIKDCTWTVGTFLATATGGASTANASSHRRVRYNAALPGWQVVG